MRLTVDCAGECHPDQRDQRPEEGTETSSKFGSQSGSCSRAS